MDPLESHSERVGALMQMLRSPGWAGVVRPHLDEQIQQHTDTAVSLEKSPKERREARYRRQQLVDLLEWIDSSIGNGRAELVKRMTEEGSSEPGDGDIPPPTGPAIIAS